jgi:hypothetical protein
MRSKKTDWQKSDRFKFLVLDISNAGRVRAELQLESQSEPILFQYMPVHTSIYY